MPLRARFFALFLLMVPGTGTAVDGCPACVLGLFDDTTLSSPYGVSAPFAAKDLYLSIDFAAPETGCAAIEFSIAGLTGSPLQVIGVTPLVPAPVTIGSPAAPADTSLTSTGTGGMDIGWSNCLPGDRALVKITVLHLVPVVDHVLRVMHKFPPSNVNYFHHPAFARCDGPTYTSVRVNGGCYVLNPTGQPLAACPLNALGVESRPWTAVKQLFR